LLLTISFSSRDRENDLIKDRTAERFRFGQEVYSGKYRGMPEELSTENILKIFIIPFRYTPGRKMIEEKEDTMLGLQPLARSSRGGKMVN
jgi:hypothetical protein